MVKQRAINLLILFALLAPVGVMSQVLTGTVSSEGTPLANATVVVKGTNIGASTDANGRYSSGWASEHTKLLSLCWVMPPEPNQFR